MRGEQVVLDLGEGASDPTCGEDVGDQVGTLKVSEIQPELITMTRGGSSYTVRLVDQDHPKKRSVTRKRTKRKRTGTTTQNITKPKTKSLSAKGSKTPS